MDSEHKIVLIKGDITKMKVDAIVNAANTSLLGGSGVDGAIHKAGGIIIMEECIKIRNKQGGCKVGHAVITIAGNLSAKYVIHTVGPNWINGKYNEEVLLELAYSNSLKLALDYPIETIAFPNISTGKFRFPPDKAARIAIKTVSNFLISTNKIKKIFIVCYNSINYNIYKSLLQE